MNKTATVEIPKNLLQPLEEVMRLNGWSRAYLVEQALSFGLHRLMQDVAVDLYAQGRIDVSRASHLADLSTGEMMELLVRRGVGSTLFPEDHTTAYEHARKFLQ